MTGTDGMGHLTAGGSVANIEAIWAGRNVKYFPLGLQEALLKDERLSGAKGYKVNFFASFLLYFIRFIAARCTGW